MFARPCKPGGHGLLSGRRDLLPQGTNAVNSRPRKPVATALRTPWAEQVFGNPLPLPEYPRPMLHRDDWLCLNGAWSYAIVPATGELASQPIPETTQGTVQVPFAIETVASGVGRTLGADETLCYRRAVELPAAWADRRVVVNFEAVDFQCVVWADGQLIGAHRGGYAPFKVELPRATGRPIDLVVAVRDPGPAGGQQYGKQSDQPGGIWYTATSGIWGSVWAEPLPANAITQINALPRPELDGFEIEVATETPTQVKIVVELPDGGLVRASGDAGRPIAVQLPEPRRWTPADPHIYPIRVSTADDQVGSWAGLRTVQVGPIPGADVRQLPAVLLNGEPIFLNTPLDQGYWPETGMTPPSDEALIFDLEQLKQLGFNGVRKHIKVESRRFYHHADRLGMLVIQDAVNGGKPWLGINGSRAAMVLDRHPPDTSKIALDAGGRRSLANREEFESDLAEMIWRLQGHPAIICWVVFNEAWGQYDSTRIAGLVRGLDPTRLIDATSGWFDQGAGDFRSRHRYVLKLVAPPRRDRRPYLLSEFGGYNLPVDGHNWEARGSYGYKFHADASQLDDALSLLYRAELIPLVAKGLRGCVYTQLSDVETETNGLFTYDRQVLKPDAAALRVLNAELLDAFAALGRLLTAEPDKPQ